MDDLLIRRVNRGSWNKWARKVMHTMRATLPKEAGLESKDIRWILANTRYIMLVATCGENFVGFTIGFFHNFDDEPEIAAIGDKHIFHLCINVIAQEFQGRGLGTKFLRDRIAFARHAGAKTCTSYGREGVSLHNLKKVGGKVIGIRENFQGSGEKFSIVRVDI